MKAGFSGTFVISWAQCLLDGQSCSSAFGMRIGMEWGWTGEALCIDGPPDILRLGPAMGADDLRQRAALSLRKRLSQGPAASGPSDTGTMTVGFTITDGRQTWEMALVAGVPDKPDLVMCAGGMPPPDQLLWIVSYTLAPANARPKAAGVICFTPGTLIQTETGLCPVEDLTEGSKVQTKDNGCQSVLWIGHRRLTGARLYAMPQLRPVRIRVGALDRAVPNPGLTVSPDHRIVLRGPRARALFNCDEVLVRARDLINDRTIQTDHSCREVTYFHLALPSHQIVFANQIETESFHPAGANLDESQWAGLENSLPQVMADLFAYGPYARRVLSHSEAAIMQHDLH